MFILVYVKSNTLIELLILLIILLNTADAVLTSIGVYRLDALEEGNAVINVLVHDVKLFIAVKMVFITGIYLIFFTYLFERNQLFNKLWESRLAVSAAVLVVSFYVLVVVRNLFLIYGV